MSSRASKSFSILLVSNYFPAHPGDRTKTRALLDFAKNWTGRARVLAIVPEKTGRDPIRLIKLCRLARLNVPIRTIVVPFFYGTACWITVVWALISILVSRNRPDIIVAHGLLGIEIGRRLAKLTFAALATGLHGTDVVTRRPEIEVAAKCADLVVFRSAPVERQFTETYGMKPGRSFVAVSGIEEGLPLSVEDARRSIMERRNGEVTVFLTAARLVKLKNIDVTMAALSRIESPWRLRILGDGPEEGTLRDMAREMGLESRISFEGWQPRKVVLEAMRSADAFVMASAPETMGLAYFEAMAMGAVVVGAKGWGIDGILEDGVSGYLVTPRDVDEMARVLAKIAAHSAEERMRIVEAALGVLSRYGEKKVALDYLAELEGVVAARIPSKSRGCDAARELGPRSEKRD